MVKTKVTDVKLIEIPKVHDVRGSLAVVEGSLIPFQIKRVYYLYDVPSTAFRGGHAHKTLQQLIIPLAGSFEVHIFDGLTKKTFTLNKPGKGLLMKPGIWREIDNFSSGAVCLVLASATYDEADYIRDKTDFIKYKGQSV